MRLESLNQMNREMKQIWVFDGQRAGLEPTTFKLFNTKKQTLIFLFFLFHLSVTKNNFSLNSYVHYMK